jgi:dihydroorotase
MKDKAMEPKMLKTGNGKGLLLMLLLSVLLPAQTKLMGQPVYDLVLTGGHVIDPKNQVNGVRDLAIRNGVIAVVGSDIDRSLARSAIDISGLYVTPGIVDIHTHLYHSTGIPGAWAGDNSVQPDSFSFRTGVTTMVDAGSSGWRNFEDFRQTVIDRAQTRTFALINIAGLGMITDMVEQGDFDPEEVARLARKHSDVVVGVKSAHYQKPDWASVENALTAGRLAKLPIMVDFGYFLPQRPYWELVGTYLRPGDISTHMFRGPVPWVDSEGRLYSYLNKARERGVIFDVGHGGGSFVLRNAAPAVQQGFYPDTISSDLHSGSRNGAMMDMPTTMSKFLALGMPLEEVVKASTWNPAKVINKRELGHLSEGAPADLAVWVLTKGNFGFRDPFGGRISGSQRFCCELTLLEGKVMWDWNARTARDYRELGNTYGSREVDSQLKP